MRKFLAPLILGVFFIGCASKDATTPIKNENQIFFKDGNIAITDLKLQQSGNESVVIDFTTLYEKNVTKIELMSGEDLNTFCSIAVMEVKENSYQKKVYEVIDDDTKSDVMHYMFRFTYSNGKWSYSPTTTIQLPTD